MPRLVAIALLATGCASKQASMKSVQFTHDEVRFERLAPGVWMHTTSQTVEPWGPVQSNGLVVVHGQGSVLVDTAWTNTQTTAILDWAENELGRPVKAAVFTHAHDDKMGGAAAVRQRSIPTWAHAKTNAVATERRLVPAQHTLTFDDTGLSTSVGGIEVVYPGPGHTDDNIVVAVPKRDLLFGGCLVRPGDAADLGNTADADLTAWPATVRSLAARYDDVEIVVPSHGAPAGPELMAHTIALADSATASVDATE